MPRVERFVSCTVVAVLLFLGSSRLTGQTPATTPTENDGRSFAVAGADDTLGPALARVDSMLRSGDLDVASIQEDTMMPGRAHERLTQHYDGVPVFGAQVVRQMDGRSVISLTGRLYEGIDLSVIPSISPARANELALATAAGSGQLHGATTLGILPMAGGTYRLVYKTEVRSDWT